MRPPSMFDELPKNHHSPPAMRLLTIIWLLVVCLAQSLRAQTTNNTNAPVQPISLEECIELALKQNLGVEIARVNTHIAAYNVNIDYAHWEPVFSASGTHSYRTTPSGLLDAQGRPIQIGRASCR